MWNQPSLEPQDTQLTVLRFSRQYSRVKILTLLLMVLPDECEQVSVWLEYVVIMSHKVAATH